MKTLFIVASILSGSLCVPVQMDYVPPVAEPDTINLATVCDWETDMEDDTLVLTLRTESGDMYVLEKNLEGEV